MKIYKLPSELKAIIFDIDGTLYTSPQYVFEQVDVQIRYWADINGWTHQEARAKMEDFRKKWAQEHEGKKISLGNAFTHFGITIEESIKWRNELLEPSKFLSHDQKLKEALQKLKEKYYLIAVTNNPVTAARKNLEAIGIEKEIPQIIGLDTCYKSKPAPDMLNKALEMAQCSAENVLSIGDRYDIDLSLPLEMGMGAVLVDGAEDIIELTETLLNCNQLNN